MNRLKWSLALIMSMIVAAAACSNQSGPRPGDSSVTQAVADTTLNSDRIRMKYGSYGVEVLYSDSTTRITSLYSEDGDRRVTRTYAIVLYPSSIDSAIIHEHNTILGGGSIGQVFKASGWVIEKRSIHFGQIEPSVQYEHIYELMGDIDPIELALYMYTFAVEKDGYRYDYAIIAEVYHPDFLSYAEINAMYAAVPEGVPSSSDIEQKLESIRRFMSPDWMIADPLSQ